MFARTSGAGFNGTIVGPPFGTPSLIHPAVLEHSYSGAMLQAIETEVAEPVDRQRNDLRDEEFALLRMLAHRAAA